MSRGDRSFGVAVSAVAAGVRDISVCSASGKCHLTAVDVTVAFVNCRTAVRAVYVIRAGHLARGGVGVLFVFDKVIL